MRRVHWFEFHDSPWCPGIWRECLQEMLSIFALASHPYDVVVGRLWEAMNRARATRIVDLCSGAGGPALGIQRALREHGLALPLVLTDKYPHPGACRKRLVLGNGDLQVMEEPVDATAVPGALQGFRTLFTAFHHFTPAQARGILADAAEQGQGIGVFEYTERNFLIWGPALLMTPLMFWICTPFLKPFRFSCFFWTYLLPVVPLIGVWDGFVSCLRTYSPAELESLKDSVARLDYHWEIGRIRSFGGCRITYLLGWPERAA